MSGWPGRWGRPDIMDKVPPSGSGSPGMEEMKRMWKVDKMEIKKDGLIGKRIIHTYLNMFRSSSYFHILNPAPSLSAC